MDIKIKKNLLFIEKNIINLKDFRSIKTQSSYSGYAYSYPYKCIINKKSEDADLEAKNVIEKIFNLLVNNSNKTLKENIII